VGGTVPSTSLHGHVEFVRHREKIICTSKEVDFVPKEKGNFKEQK